VLAGSIVVSLAVGFLIGRRWFPRRAWLVGSILPRFVVRYEPINAVLYAGNDPVAAKARYHEPIPAVADEVLLYDGGKLRGQRARVQAPATRTA
jgi:hypothetical protein